MLFFLFIKYIFFNKNLKLSPDPEKVLNTSLYISVYLKGVSENKK